MQVTLFWRRNELLDTEHQVTMTLGTEREVIHVYGNLRRDLDERRSEVGSERFVGQVP